MTVLRGAERYLIRSPLGSGPQVRGRSREWREVE